MKSLGLMCLLLLFISGTAVFGDESHMTAIRTDFFGSIKSALGQFEVDVGRYPTTAEGLAALVQCPKNLSAAHWHGPYLEKIPIDPWGTPFGYVFPATNGTNWYGLYSCGADRISKSQGNDLDDINTWDPSSPRGGNDDAQSGLRKFGMICLVVGTLGAVAFAFNRFWKSAKGKSLSSRKMWDGILSVVWLGLGFVVLPLLDNYLVPVSFDLALIEFIVWLGGGILLALSGLRSGSRIGIAAALMTILGSFYLLWQFYPHVQMYGRLG